MKDSCLWNLLMLHNDCCLVMVLISQNVSTRCKLVFCMSTLSEWLQVLFRGSSVLSAAVSRSAAAQRTRQISWNSSSHMLHPHTTACACQSFISFKGTTLSFRGSYLYMSYTNNILMFIHSCPKMISFRDNVTVNGTRCETIKSWDSCSYMYSRESTPVTGHWRPRGV